MRTLETERLLLRDWKRDDLKQASVLWDDADITVRYLILKKNNYAVILKKTGQIIGTIGLNEDADENPKARNVGIRLVEECRNQGLISEALRAIIDMAHEITPYLSYVHAKDDLKSAHIAEKFGFVHIKDFVQIQRTQDDTQKDYKYYLLET